MRRAGPPGSLMPRTTTTRTPRASARRHLITPTGYVSAPPWAIWTCPRHRLNLTIRPNCTVHRIRFEGDRATGVELETEGEKFTVEGEEIVLSAGAVGSPHMLMLSGVGPGDHLAEFGIPLVADLPGVGKNLRDHPLAWVTWRTREDFPLDGVAPRMQVCLRYTAEGSHLRNDMKVSMQSYATNASTEAGIGWHPWAFA